MMIFFLFSFIWLQIVDRNCTATGRNGKNYENTFLRAQQEVLLQTIDVSSIYALINILSFHSMVLWYQCDLCHCRMPGSGAFILLYGGGWNWFLVCISQSNVPSLFSENMNRDDHIQNNIYFRWVGHFRFVMVWKVSRSLFFLLLNRGVRTWSSLLYC